MAKVTFEFINVGNVECKGNTVDGIRMNVAISDCSPEGGCGPQDLLAHIIAGMAAGIIEKASKELLRKVREQGIEVSAELICSTKQPTH